MGAGTTSVMRPKRDSSSPVTDSSPHPRVCHTRLEGRVSLLPFLPLLSLSLLLFASSASCKATTNVTVGHTARAQATSQGAHTSSAGVGAGAGAGAVAGAGAARHVDTPQALGPLEALVVEAKHQVQRMRERHCAGRPRDSPRMRQARLDCAVQLRMATHRLDQVSFAIASGRAGPGDVPAWLAAAARLASWCPEVLADVAAFEARKAGGHVAHNPASRLSPAGGPSQIRTVQRGGADLAAASAAVPSETAGISSLVEASLAVYRLSPTEATEASSQAVPGRSNLETGPAARGAQAAVGPAKQLPAASRKLPAASRKLPNALRKVPARKIPAGLKTPTGSVLRPGVKVGANGKGKARAAGKAVVRPKATPGRGIAKLAGAAKRPRVPVAKRPTVPVAKRPKMPVATRPKVPVAKRPRVPVAKRPTVPVAKRPRVIPVGKRPTWPVAKAPSTAKKGPQPRAKGLANTTGVVQQGGGIAKGAKGWGAQNGKKRGTASGRRPKGEAVNAKTGGKGTTAGRGSARGQGRGKGKNDQKAIQSPKKVASAAAGSNKNPNPSPSPRTNPSPSPSAKPSEDEGTTDGSRVKGASSSQPSPSPAPILKYPVEPDAVVSQDKGSEFGTIQAALDHVAGLQKQPCAILVHRGVYRELLTIDIPQLYLYGEDPETTVIWGNRSWAFDDATGASSAIVSVLADGFVAMYIAFENTAGPWGQQAIALRVDSDKSAFYNCHFLGFQDTLLANTGRQYYKNCRVTGSVDFVYGDAIAVFESCQFVFRHGKGKKVYLTASKRELPNSPTGIVLQNSTIELESTADVGVTIGYFGRPWRDYARTVILNSYLGEGAIGTERWSPWNSDTKSAFYGEYRNSGPSSGTAGEASWVSPGQLSDAQADGFSCNAFANCDTWVPQIGLPQ